jgi:hypothetical protein
MENINNPVGSATEEQKPEEQKIEVSKTDFELLLKRVKESEEAIEKIKKGGIDRPKRVQEDTAYVRMVDEKIVIGIGKKWSEAKRTKLNEKDEERLFAQLKLENDTEKTVDFVDFLNNSDMVYGLIKKIDKKDASRNHGQALAEEQDPYNRRMSGKGFEPFRVDIVETATDDDFTLEIMQGERAGQKITLHNSVINL